MRQRGRIRTRYLHNRSTGWLKDRKIIVPANKNEPEFQTIVMFPRELILRLGPKLLPNPAYQSSGLLRSLKYKKLMLCN